MALAMTRLVAGAVVALLSVVVVELAASQLAGGLWIFDRLGVGASSWAGLGLEFLTFAVRPRRGPGWFQTMAGGCACSGHAQLQTA